MEESLLKREKQTETEREREGVKEMRTVTEQDKNIGRHSDVGDLSSECQNRIIMLMEKKASNFRTNVRMRHSKT
jgi:hypothetical protein